jgi:sporulation protein YlmC with PRC-barrel domain
MTREDGMKASALKSMAVISMADGINIGRVEDVLFDTTNLRVAALALTTSGGQSVLPFSSVHRIGADAVTVETAGLAQPAVASARGTALRHLSDLIGLKVVNGEGTYLGDVREVLIDQVVGGITELEAHRGGMLGMGGTSVHVRAADIRGIGPDLVTATMPAQPFAGEAADSP